VRSLDTLRDEEVDARGEHEQRNEARIPRTIEEIASREQQSVLSARAAAFREQSIRRVKDGDENEKPTAIEEHYALRHCIERGFSSNSAKSQTEFVLRRADYVNFRQYVYN
jgi:hypothetical protein